MAMSRRYDIRRAVQEVDSVLGGVTVTSTSIETRDIELQNLNGQDMLAIGGLRLEAQYKGFCHKDTDIREQDVISPNSGTTRYQVVFVQDLLDEHIQFFAKRVE